MKKRRNRRVSGGKANDKELHAKLNAIIRLLIELNRNMNKDEFNIRSTAKMLHSVGLAPKEIANILGYKSSTDVAPYLYSKRKRKTKSRQNNTYK